MSRGGVMETGRSTRQASREDMSGEVASELNCVCAVYVAVGLFCSLWPYVCIVTYRSRFIRHGHGRLAATYLGLHTFLASVSSLAFSEPKTI